MFNDLLGPIFSNPAFILARNLSGLFAVVLYGAIVFWTYRDAERRGAMGWFWALVTLIFFPFFPYPGLIIYLIARPAESVGRRCTSESLRSARRKPRSLATTRSVPRASSRSRRTSSSARRA